MASILAQVGFDGQFFGRLDWVDKDDRMANKTAEMIWHGSPNLGKNPIQRHKKLETKKNILQEAALTCSLEFCSINTKLLQAFVSTFSAMTNLL